MKNNINYKIKQSYFKKAEPFVVYRLVLDS
jgi:hypothetical protein